jgi:hypothetical protein
MLTMTVSLTFIFPACADTSLVKQFLDDPRAKEESLGLAQVETFIFSPNPKGYFCQAKGMIFWNNLPESLVKDIRLHAGTSGIRCLAMGLGEKWVVVHGDGSMAWEGVGTALADKLRDCRPKEVKVCWMILSSLCVATDSSPTQFITLSLDVDDYYFIDFDDGSTAYRLSTAWQTKVDEHTVQSQTNALAREDLADALRTQQAANQMRSTQRAIDLLNMATRMADRQRFRMQGGEEVVVERRYQNTYF